MADIKVKKQTSIAMDIIRGVHLGQLSAVNDDGDITITGAYYDGERYEFNLGKMRQDDVLEFVTDAREFLSALVKLVED